MARLVNVALCVFLGLASVRFVACQEEPARDASRLLPDFSDRTNPSTASLALVVPLLSETAAFARYTLLLSVVIWDRFAVCDPSEKALNFWGERVQLPKEVCEDSQTPGLLSSYTFIRAMEGDFSEIADSHKAFMRSEGFDPEDRSEDTATALGMANSIGRRVADWAAKDGWNSLGDRTRMDFRQNFEDYTDYKPVNPPWALNYPLRWQPLTQADPTRIGRFITQTHAVPFLGQVRPLLISEEELAAKQAPMPYENMNSTELSGKDKETMDALVMDLFETSENLTPAQRFLASWWDNKVLSISSFVGGYNANVGLDPAFLARWALVQALAQYDAMIVAWKEKRRIDAVRPDSIIKNLYRDWEVTAYVPKEGKAKTIKAGDWEPLIPTPAHSEYPSASATLCTAFADAVTLMVRELMAAKGLDKEVPTILNTPQLAAEGVTEIRFETLEEAGKNCGLSRLWAGGQFGPSVPAGEELANGIGQKAYEFMLKMAGGEVPENCWWCSNA